MTALAKTIRRARAVSVVWRLGRGKLAAASVNLLNACNQACPMCEVHRTSAAALSLEDLARAARALRRAGVQVVELSGGEPFLRKDLAKILRLLDAEGLLYTFNTNATQASAEGIAALRDGRGLLQVAVSLDSLDRERYRLLRGRDQLDDALRGLDRLRAAELPAALKVNFAMSRHNEAETPALLEFARARGLFLSAFPVNQGPGAHRSSEGLFDATADERERMALRFDALAALRRRGEPLWEPSAFYEAAADFLRHAPLRPCRAGELFLDVRADGAVAPCVDLPAVATLAELESGVAGPALRAARGAVVACRRDTPCCYTCTVNLAETGAHPVRWALETAAVLGKAWWRQRGARASS